MTNPDIQLSLDQQAKRLTARRQEVREDAEAQRHALWELRLWAIVGAITMAAIVALAVWGAVLVRGGL